MGQPNPARFVDVPWNDAMEAEWQRQMGVIRNRNDKGKTLWLIIRRAMLMVIRALDEHYGIARK